MQRHNGNQVRIIAGEWRGRKLSFPTIAGLRPTGDRMRETLFNWLAPTMVGADCLDLFAGSGALGFEAASRGAGQVLLVERNAQAAKALRHNCERLQADNIRVVQDDAFALLARTSSAYDLLFLDPPFQLSALSRLCELLVRNGWVHTESLLYLEYALSQPPELPMDWRVIKEKKAGGVGYYLVAV